MCCHVSGFWMWHNFLLGYFSHSNRTFFYKGEYYCGKYKYAFSSISQLNTQTNKKNIMKSLRFLRNQLNDSDSAKLAKDFFCKLSSFKQKVISWKNWGYRIGCVITRVLQLPLKKILLWWVQQPKECSRYYKILF